MTAVDTSCAVPWCDQRGSEGHPFETCWPTKDGPPARTHVAACSEDELDVSVSLTARQDLGGNPEPVELHLDAIGVLSPEQALKVAGWLTVAAERLAALR